MDFRWREISFILIFLNKKSRKSLSLELSLLCLQVIPLTKHCARGMTELVLHEAAVNGEYQQLESMLMIHRIDIDHKDEDFGDRTALHWAASRGWRISHPVINYYYFVRFCLPCSRVPS